MIDADAERCGDCAAERACVIESSPDLVLGGALENRRELPVEADEQIGDVVGPTGDGLRNRPREAVHVRSGREIFPAGELWRYEGRFRTRQDGGIDPCR